MAGFLTRSPSEAFPSHATVTVFFPKDFMNSQQRVLCRILTCFPLKISLKIFHHKIGGKNNKNQEISNLFSTFAP